MHELPVDVCFAATMDDVLKAALESSPFGRTPPPEVAAEALGDADGAKKAGEVRA